MKLEELEKDLLTFVPDDDPDGGDDDDDNPG